MIDYILLVPFTLFDPVILIVAMAKKVWNALIFPSNRLYILYKVKFQPRRLSLLGSCFFIVLWNLFSYGDTV